jgi:hypothetical protein
MYTSEELQAGVRRAMEKGYKQAAIARAAGTSSSNLGNFVNTGYLGDDKKRSLAEWLHREGIMRPGSLSISKTEQSDNNDPVSGFAEQMRILLAVLESSATENLKREYLYAFLDGIRAGEGEFGKWLRALKK